MYLNIFNYNMFYDVVYLQLHNDILLYAAVISYQAESWLLYSVRGITYNDEILKMTRILKRKHINKIDDLHGVATRELSHESEGSDYDPRSGDIGKQILLSLSM